MAVKRTPCGKRLPQGAAYLYYKGIPAKPITDDTAILMATTSQPLYEFPLALDSNLDAIALGPRMQLIRLEEDARKRLLKISDVKLNSDGRVTEMQTHPGVERPNASQLNRLHTLFASNYLFTTTESDVARTFNFALKLMGISWSSISVGYGPDGSALYHSPPAYFGKTRLQIEESDADELRNLVEKILKEPPDPKLQLMQEIWMHAMSDAPSARSRYVETSTLLEMLLLPKQSAELAFRFSLRFAKLAKRIGYHDIEEVFNKAKIIYEIRSKLVHSGRDSRLSEFEYVAYEFARVFLRHYVEKPDDFTDKNLDKLCIAASQETPPK